MNESTHSSLVAAKRDLQSAKVLSAVTGGGDAGRKPTLSVSYSCLNCFSLRAAIVFERERR